MFSFSENSNTLKERKKICHMLKLSSSAESPIHEIVMKEKEIHNSFAATDMSTVNAKYSVKLKATTNMSLVLSEVSFLHSGTGT